MLSDTQVSDEGVFKLVFGSELLKRANYISFESGKLSVFEIDSNSEWKEIIALTFPY